MNKRKFLKKLGCGVIGIASIATYIKTITDGPGPPIIFTSNNKEILRLECTGNVGMGTTSPKLLLHVSNDIRIL